MSFKDSSASRAYWGLLSLACYSRSLQFDAQTDMLDVSVICNTAKAWIPGKTSASLSLGGPLDTDATSNGFDDAMRDLKAGSAPVTYAPEGTAAGATVLMGLALQTNISTSSALSGTVDWSATGEISGPFEVGAAVETETAITVDTNGAAQDNGAATSNGGVAHLHVTAFSGLTNDVITIEHSVDGSTSWATLATFSTVSGVTSERVEVAAATTVRRYLRVADNVTGTGSITRFVAFARR